MRRLAVVLMALALAGCGLLTTAPDDGRNVGDRGTPAPDTTHAQTQTR